MASLNDFLDILLKQFSTNLNELNKRGNQALKQGIFKEVFGVALIQSREGGKTGKPRMGEAIRQTRATGLKFANQAAREEFYARTERVFKASDVTKLKDTSKPNPRHLPQLTSSKVRGGYLYAARVYLTSKRRKDNTKKIPFKTNVGRVIKLSKVDKYSITGKYGFWSDKLLSKELVYKIFKAILTKTDQQLVNQYVVQDTNTSDIDFNIYKPVAFLYTGALSTGGHDEDEDE